MCLCGVLRIRKIRYNTVLWRWVGVAVHLSKPQIRPQVPRLAPALVLAKSFLAWLLGSLKLGVAPFAQSSFMGAPPCLSKRKRWAAWPLNQGSTRPHDACVKCSPHIAFCFSPLARMPITATSRRAKLEAALIFAVQASGHLGISKRAALQAVANAFQRLCALGKW